MPADHGTPNTGDERDREIEAVAAAYGREAFESGDARLAAAAAIDALDAVRAPSPSRDGTAAVEDHEGHGVLQEDNDTGVLSEPQSEGWTLKPLTWTVKPLPSGEDREECHCGSADHMAAQCPDNSLPPARDGTVAVEDVARLHTAARAYFREFDHLIGDVDYPERRDLREALAEFGVSERIHDQATKENRR